jgi:TetR/AcrR family transcriptional repressor of nem operon
MPWPEDHKARTREKIVEAAAAAFRAGGVEGVGLEDVMARAGLTHGGFYAHFASKEELLRAAVEHASHQTVDLLSRSLARTPAGDRFHAVIDMYLTPAHAAHPEWGCPLATLAPEIARAGGATRGALAEGVRERLAWMRQLRPDGRPGAKPDVDAIGALACMVGGVILARSVGAKDSAAVLEGCREFLRRATTTSSAKRAARPRAKRRRVRNAARRP